MSEDRRQRGNPDLRTPEERAWDARADAALDAAVPGLEAGVSIDSPDEVEIDGRLSPAQLRAIADVMDALREET